MADIVSLIRVTNGRTSVIHRAEWNDKAPLGAPMPKTLCGRSTDGMLSLNRMGAWERTGWEASSAGPCQRCQRAESVR